MKKWIELYQEVKILVPPEKRGSVLGELQSRAAPPWRFDAKASLSARERIPDSARVCVFLWDDAAEFPSAMLTLAENDEGFYVASLGPNGRASINRTQHNNILNDFANRVIAPVAIDNGLKCEVSDRYKSLSDFLDEEALGRFNAIFHGRNFSPETLHPADATRWLEFLVAAHRSEKKLNSDNLARWLIEIEEWTIKEAAITALRYSEGITLLEYYDSVLARQALES